MLPVENEFRVAVQIPIHANVSHRDFISPVGRIGEVAIEDFITQIKVAIPNKRFKRSPLRKSASWIERP